MDNQCFGSGPFIWTERVEGRWPVEEVKGKWWGKSRQAVSGAGWREADCSMESGGGGKGGGSDRG